MTGRIALRTYRFAPRKACIEVEGRRVRLYLPSYFGRRRWDLDGTRLAVADLASLPESSSVEVDTVLSRPVVLPYLFTTGPLTSPNLLLLFAAPCRVPPLRLFASLAPNADLPFGFYATRSRRGSVTDGVLLRATDPAAALDRLREAGAQPTDDPEAWLADHRDVVTDPARRTSILRREDRARRLVIGSNVILGASLLALAAAAKLIDDDVLGRFTTAAGLLGLLAAGALRLLARRITT